MLLTVAGMAALMLLTVAGIAALAGGAAFVLVVVTGLVVLTTFLILVALVSLAVVWYVVRRARAPQRIHNLRPPVSA